MVLIVMQFEWCVVCHRKTNLTGFNQKKKKQLKQ